MHLLNRGVIFLYMGVKKLYGGSNFSIFLVLSIGGQILSIFCIGVNFLKFLYRGRNFGHFYIGGQILVILCIGGHILVVFV